MSKLNIPTICVIFLLIYLNNCLSQDTLEDIKNFYNDHEEYHVQKIPVVEDVDGIYDFIIVGAGSAGTVLANRLSEISNWKVLVIEAGEQADFLTDIPLLTFASANTKYDWNYTSTKQTKCCASQEGKCSLIRGKALGGTSVLNNNFYLRGNKLVYDYWEELGNIGWSYKDIQPIFKKSENMQIPELRQSPFHGTEGLLYVNEDAFKTPATPMMFNAGKELGYDVIDYNGANNTGFANIQFTIKNGKRLSGAEAFLRPASARKNLSIMSSARVTQIIMDYRSKKAVGVKFVKNGRLRRVYASKEVIMSAGSLNTPALLMLSGIGPSNILKELDIDVVQELDVGKNLLDHPGMILQVETTMDGLIHDDVLSNSDDIEKYFVKGEGSLASPGLAAFGFVKTNLIPETEDFPDIELILSNNDVSAFGLREQDSRSKRRKITKNTRKNKRKEKHKIRSNKKYLINFLVMVLDPESSGTVKIVSKDPEVHPEIDINCFGNEKDLETLKKGLKLAVKVARTKAFAKYNTTLNPTPYPGCEDLKFESDEYWECAIRQVGSTLHHQVGTCKMGPASDPTAVVDPRLRVHGILGLRVVDASIMPTIPAAHPNAVVYMIAEKAADMIKQDWLGNNYQNQTRHRRRRRMSRG